MNQQQAAVSAWPSSTKSASVGGSTDTSASAMSFSYPAMAANETQYLAIMQNNAYPFPIPANYRGNMALLNGSFYSFHPSQQTPSLQSQKQRPQSSGGAGSTNISFDTRNGANTSPGIDTSSRAQNHVIMAGQKKHFRECEDEKCSDGERKSWTTKAERQSIGFSTSDSASAAVSSTQANGANATTAAVNNSSNSSSTTAAKIPGGFPQNFVQSSSSHSEWRNSSKTSSASVFQHQCRSSAQMKTQISFGGNEKSSTSTSTCEGQAAPSNSNSQPKSSPSIHAMSMQQAQLFFSSSSPAGFYVQASANDPAKAIAVNVKGGGISFSYPHLQPAAEQKQPAG